MDPHELRRIKIMIGRIEVLKSELEYWEKEADWERQQLERYIGDRPTYSLSLRGLYDLYKELYKSDQ